MPTEKPLLPVPSPSQLTATQFAALATVSAEHEWFANLSNTGTGRVYQLAIRDFLRFARIEGHAGRVQERHPRPCDCVAR